MNAPSISENDGKGNPTKNYIEINIDDRTRKIKIEINYMGKEEIDGIALALILAGFFAVYLGNNGGWVLVIMGVLKQLWQK